MSAHLRAYVAVLILCVIALIFFRKPFGQLVGRKRVDNWAITWLAVTSCAFLLTSYWIYIVASMLVVFVLSRGEPFKPAIYLLLLSVVPTLGESIPGFAGINKFIEVNPQLAVAAVVLLPVMLVGRHMRKLNKTGGGADLFFLLFVILQVSLAVRADSFTHMLRTGIQDFLAIAPAYYVFSRYPKSFEDIRVVSAAFVFPVLVLCVVSIPEFAKSWHFYYSVSTNWFGQMPFGYVHREGYLRASASVFNPIVWGFVAMSGMGVGIALLNDGVSRFYRYASFALLAAGLIVSLSRGPWVGAIAILGMYILLSPRMVMRAVQAGVVGVIGFGVSLLTPFGKSVVGMIPFIGSSDDGTITYRRRLLDQAWDVILQNPLVGSGKVGGNTALETLRQGQGIIDIVNTYLQIGLRSGLLGIGLFVAFFLAVLLSLRKAMNSAKKYDPKMANYCRAYLATLFGVLVTIFTTSSEGQIPYIYWALAGVGIALARIEAANRPNGTQQPKAAAW
ncbi:MAG: O-antigen ligase family protein [Hyphococcus sp.]